MPNRLASEASLYLRQHAHNPVDWFPWGPEAFEKAKAEDKPIFLSVGYSSCHWCHVMERESFENENVAQILNEKFISIKVDREERPDIDETYMTAVQLYSGRGGWPMSVFLTPDGDPFFAGTYFPPQNRGRFPSFRSILMQIDSVWNDRREEALEVASTMADQVKKHLAQPAPPSNLTLGPTFFESTARRILERLNPDHGGFGGAPAFPPHSTLDLLLSLATDEELDADLREAALGAVLFTMEKMALGGIHDHVAGGFHRYSTDAEWHLPHFEKMLYDNGLHLSLYARVAELLHDADPRLSAFFSRIATGIVRWLETEMRSPEGLYYSALDADANGEEGLTYTWTMPEVRNLLGDDADAFLEAYGFAMAGNFDDEATGERTGQNVLHLESDPGDAFDGSLAVLREARKSKPQPVRDDKCLVSWNSLAIIGLVHAGRIDLATQAADFILQGERLHGRLPHQFVEGVPMGDAFLDGVAGFALALRVLGTFDARYQAESARLAATLLPRFGDPMGGGFFLTPVDGEVVLGRSKPIFDTPIPSPTSMALRLLGGQSQFAPLIGWMAAAPEGTAAMIAAAHEIVCWSSASNEVWVDVGLRREGDDVVWVLPEGWTVKLDSLRIETPDGIALATPSEEPKDGDRFTAPGTCRVAFMACTDNECLPLRTVVV